jgi:hypothetical protein
VDIGYQRINITCIDEAIPVAGSRYEIFVEFA